MNKAAIIKALRDTAQSASNSAAANVTAPIDLMAGGFKKIGVPIPDNYFGGSQWAEQMGLMRRVEPGIPQAVGETLGMLPVAGAAARAQALNKVR